MLHEHGGIACARPCDGEHEQHRRHKQHTCQRAARAAFKNQHEHIFECAARLPVCAEKAENEIQRRQQGAGQHEIIVGQRIQPAEERQQSAPGMIAHRVLHAQQNQREKRDDFQKVIKLRVDDGERRKGIEHAAQQREPLFFDHPPQIAKRGQRADGMFEHCHHADAKWNERLGQKRQRPDKHAPQCIKRVTADGGRAEEGVEAVTVQTAVQNPPRFKDEGELLLDEVAARDETPAIGQDGRGERQKRQKSAQKKRMRAGDAPLLKRRSLHGCSSLRIARHTRWSVSMVLLYGCAAALSRRMRRKPKRQGETGVSGNAFEMFFHGDFLFTKSKGGNQRKLMRKERDKEKIRKHSLSDSWCGR